MERFLLWLGWLCVFFGSPLQADWRAAVPGWEYQFPRDHFNHPEFKTEWWYFTGNLEDTNGRRFGYQLTLFRQGVRSVSERGDETSRFVLNDLKFGHFAMSDVASQEFFSWQKLSRGAFGEAGFGAPADPASAPSVLSRLAWLESWSVECGADGRFVLRASAPEGGLELTAVSSKPWTIHGANGVSQKAEGDGHASHYYSATRMSTRGTLQLRGRAYAVSGESWFDHEWASNQLAPGQLGWNWMSLQLSNGCELMLYQMRLSRGGVDPASSATWVDADGRSRALRREDYELSPVDFWTSKKTGARYPVSWRVRVPSLAIELTVRTPMPNQEMVFPQVAYWEGLVDAEGRVKGQPVQGRGYVELTGYAGPLRGLGK
jgi:predicted secreted hydrolase